MAETRQSTKSHISSSPFRGEAPSQIASSKRFGGPGVVRPDELYTLDEIKQRLGLREAGLRAARRAGLPVIYLHGRGLIWGGDLIAYVLADRNAAGLQG